MSAAMSTMIQREALRQHQPPATLKLVEEIEAVVGCHPLKYVVFAMG